MRIDTHVRSSGHGRSASGEGGTRTIEETMAPPASPRSSSFDWRGVLLIVTLAGFVVYAHRTQPDMFRVLIMGGVSAVAVLLILKLWLPVGYASFDRPTTVIWLIGYGACSTAFGAVLRWQQTGSAALRSGAVALTLVGIIALLIAFRESRERARRGAANRPDLMLVGSALTLIAIAVHAVDTFCPANSDCIDYEDLNLSFTWSAFLICFAALVVVRELRGRERMPGILASDAVPALFAAAAATTALWHLRFHPAALLWFAGTALVIHALHLRSKETSAIGRWIAPERAWSGFGPIVLIGIGLCDVSLYLAWSQYNAVVDQFDRVVTAQWFPGHMVMYPAQMWVFTLILIALMVKPPHWRKIADITSLALAVLTGFWWAWRIHQINAFAEQPNRLLHWGSALFGVGMLLVVGGMCAITMGAGRRQLSLRQS
jgi:hypothetical protein